MRKKKFDIEDVFSQNGNIAFLDAEFNAGMDYKRGDYFIINIKITRHCLANWVGVIIANNLRKGKIRIEDDTGEMNTDIEDERSALEIAKYIFIKVHYGMRVKVTMYYDKDGNICSDSDDWEDYDTLLDLCSPSYE